MKLEPPHIIFTQISWVKSVSIHVCLFWSANMRQILIFDKSAYLEQVCNLIASPCIAVWTRNETRVCYRIYQEYGENHRNILSSINPIPWSVGSSLCAIKNGILETIFFIGPESDHWQPLSVTNWLTHSGLVDLNLIGVTLAWKDANSKLVKFADVDDEENVGNSLLQI